MRRIQVVDSHTGGEPTRLVLEGLPALGGGSVETQAKRFQKEHDSFRRLVVNEPRGSDVLVGAMLVPSENPECYSGLIFFNNVGLLGMCGHGTIGVVATLAHMSRTGGYGMVPAPIGVGELQFETSVGVVTTRLHDDGRVSVRNVPSYRFAADVVVDVPGHGKVRGDVAWGGNWFFFTEDHEEQLTLDRVERLTDMTWRIRKALVEQNVTGEGGEEIDHIELLSRPMDAKNHSRNFVLCPGKAYDRSPCGTGTSAKLACLAARGKLAPGEIWRQESVSGSVFEGSYEFAPETGRILPTVTGTAYVMAESTLLLHEDDHWQN